MTAHALTTSSDLSALKIIRNNLLPFKPFTAINLLGVMFVRSDARIDEPLINHERIHTAQMLELWVVPFYVLYIGEWLVRVTCFRSSFRDAYMNLSFEREAYRHMYEPEYHDKRRRWAMWLRSKVAE